jgi:hypothetical protein
VRSEEIEAHLPASGFDVLFIRFLGREEYDALCDVIRTRFQGHLPEFIFSVHTDLRLTEQYSCTWAQVDFRRRTIFYSQPDNSLSLSDTQCISSTTQAGKERSEIRRRG